jgi:hypothetical protein
VVESAFQIGEGVRRVNYRRHGFGRGSPARDAKRSSQACTSSAA